MTDTTLAIKALQNDSYLQGMRDIMLYMMEGEGMPALSLLTEIRRVKLSHDARKLEPYRKSEAMLQMREISQQEMEQDNE